MATTHVRTPSQTIIFTTFFLIFTVTDAATPLNALRPHEKFTKIHFYFQSADETVAQIAAPKTIDTNTDFGVVFAMDNTLTETPDPESKVLGKARGFFLFASMEEIDLWQSMNLVFTSGKYNGSTLTVIGRNNEQYTGWRELPVVGGTGLFRLARGFARAKTYKVEPTRVTVEYNVYVFHYATAFPVDDESTSSIM